MATTEDNPVGTTDAQTAASNLNGQSTSTNVPNTQVETSPSGQPRSSTSRPMEMTSISPTHADDKSQPRLSQQQSHDLDQSLPTRASAPTTQESTNPAPSTSHNIPSSNPIPPIRQHTTPGIGPSTDKPSPLPKESEMMGPTLMITLLLNTGARHPYKIDEKYLKKRNVSVTGNNPVNMSVYTLKELIWREWREGKSALLSCYDHANTTRLEWEPRPSSPSSIRLIHYGKLLDDKAHLKGDYNK